MTLTCGTFTVNQSYQLTVSYMTEAIGMGKNSYTNWKKDLTDKRKGAKHVNNCKYSQEEREQALSALKLNPDMNPYELQAKYLDEHGIYLGSTR